MRANLPIILGNSNAFPTEFIDNLKLNSGSFFIQLFRTKDETLKFLKENEVSMLIFSQVDMSGESQSLIAEFDQIKPNTPRVFVGDQINEIAYRSMVNNGYLTKFIILPSLNDQDSIKEVADKIGTFLSEVELSTSRVSLVKESAQKNRELEKLTVNLEAIVEERTKHIEDFNKEQIEKLNKERQIVRFIREVESQELISEILNIVRKELRKINLNGELILLQKKVNAEDLYYYYTKANWKKGKLNSKYKALNPDELSIHFANFFGRPFGKISMYELTDIYTLIVEKTLKSKESKQIDDFLKERIGVLSVVFEKAHIERLIHDEAHRWESTFDGMVNPIAIIDSQFNVIRSNSNFSVFGEQSNKCYVQFANRDKPCENCPLQKGSGQINKDKKIYKLYSDMITSHDVSNAVNPVFVHQYVDITEERRLFEKIVQAEKIEAIGLLAGNLAHELNNPLTGIKSLVEVLKLELESKSEGKSEGSDKDSARKKDKAASTVSSNKQLLSDLTEIQKATERSQKIIKNLLEFSSGTSKLMEVSIDDIVQNTIPLIKSLLRNHRSNILLNSKTALIKVEPQLLQQVIINLINNAAQAMQSPGEISIKSEIDGNSVVLEISDTGPGVPREIQEKIFKSFFTTKAQGQGTGLGLSMSKSIVEKFNGKIRYEDNIPQGAKFILNFPVNMS